ncbi:BREX-2 system phosphatase PglZ [Haliangium sp.]|uniref:BREX-2 system phosphatase PglZ n=1 Tax=Haliangium sp. TaxID=2663208 RepID=UPI003D1149CC
MIPVEAPTLSVADIKAELQAIFERDRRSWVVALYGTAEATEVEVTVQGQRTCFAVVPVDCELALRDRLARGDDGGDEALALALVVSYTADVPPDIAGRLAGGRVRLVTGERRLARIFTATGTHPELFESPLKQALLAQPGKFSGPIAGTIVSLETAWRRFLDREAGLREDEVLSAQQVAHFCAEAAGGVEFGRRWAGHEAVRAALYEFLDGHVGELGRRAWQAWEQGRGTELAAWAVLLETLDPLVPGSEALQLYLPERLAQVAPGIDLVRDEALVRAWGALAKGLRLRMSESGFARLVAQADGLVSNDKLAEALLDNPYLASSFARARDQLAASLRDATESLTAERFAAARRDLKRLEGHLLKDEAGHASTVVRARMAVRLLAYLLGRERAPLELGETAQDATLALAEHYAAEGGFVDYARRRAQGSDVDALGRAIAAVLAAVNERRDRDDERFARGLQSWLHARRPHDRAVAVDKALDRFAVGFLAGGRHRKLLVLLLDGLSWSVAVELMLDLEGHCYGPVKWRPEGYHGASPLPPMLAAFPTITEVSRSALFAGKPMAVGKSHQTRRDPDRFEAHRGLSKLLGEGPRLLLEAEAANQSGFAGEALRALIRSDDRVVGVVVNAVDDYIKSSMSLEVAFGRETIKVLHEVLELATGQDRAVLIVADHGHAGGERMEYVNPTSTANGARWRELEEDEEPAEYEVALAGEGAWSPHPRRRVAMLATETKRYVSGRHTGEHGGATLAEVVAPALLLGSDRLAASPTYHDDAALGVTALTPPPWWDCEVAPERAPGPARAAPAARPGGRGKRPTPAPNQVTMPFVEAAAEAAAEAGTAVDAGAAAAPSWVRQCIEASGQFEGLNKKRRAELEAVIAQVEVLVDYGDGGRLSDRIFAHRVGVPKRQVEGVVARIGEYLTIDGYAVVRYEGEQVVFDADLFRDMFEA